MGQNPSATNMLSDSQARPDGRSVLSGCGEGYAKHLIDLDLACQRGKEAAAHHIRIDDVVTNQLKVRMPEPVGDRGLGAGHVVVQHDHIVPQQHQPIHEMRADEARSAGDEHTLAFLRTQQAHGRVGCRRRECEGPSAFVSVRAHTSTATDDGTIRPTGLRIQSRLGDPG